MNIHHHKEMKEKDMINIMMKTKEEEEKEMLLVIMRLIMDISNGKISMIMKVEEYKIEKELEIKEL